MKRTNLNPSPGIALRSTRTIAALVVAAASVTVTAAHAANIAYSTTPADANFGGINWTNGVTVPGAPQVAAASGDALYFGGTPTFTTLNNDLVGATYASLTFNSGSAAFTIGGNAFALGGNIANNSTTAKTIDNNIDLGTAVHTVNASSGTITFGGNISGTGATATTVLDGNTTGTGALILAGTNTYTGTTRIRNGLLRVTGSLADTSGVLVTGGSYDVASNDTVGAVTLNNASITSTTGSFTLSPASVGFGNTGTGTFSATISANIGGTGTLSKTAGSGNVLLTGANTYSGGTTFTAAGTRIQITNASGLGTGTVTQSGQSTLQLNLTGTNTVANTFAPITPGNVTVSGSTITAAATPTFLNTAGTNTISSNLTHANASGGNGFSIASDAGLLTIAGNVSNLRPNTTNVLALGGAGNGVVSGAILQNTATEQEAVVKYGGGIWALTGANTYATTTQIVGGTLVTGSTSALGTSAVNVTNVGSNLTVGNGTVNTVGGLTGLTMANSTVLDITALNSQVVLASGVFSLGNITLDLNSAFSSFGSDQTFTLIDGVDGANAIGAVAIVNDNPAYTYTFSVVGNDGVLSVTNVPEPTALAVVGLGAIVALRRRRTA